MEAKTIIKEIQRLPLNKRFWVIEQILKSIKKEDINYQADVDFDSERELSLLSVSEKSLAKDWLSNEDNRWDKIL